jgi:2-oxoglutarate ferredoxin oxidoreductase subunit delta
MGARRSSSRQRQFILIYNDSVAKTKDISQKQLPVFALSRCKQCGICSHFCPTHAIGVHDDGTPFLADPEACTSCGLCQDMCPDWAVCVTAPKAPEAAKGEE